MSRDYRTLFTVLTLLYFTYRALNILYAVPAWELCRYYKHVGRSYIDAIRTFPVPMETLPYRREKETQLLPGRKRQSILSPLLHHDYGRAL